MAPEPFERRESRRGLNRITHGATRHGRREPLYHVWKGMRERCRNPNSISWKYYGGKGVTICAEWISDFSAFRTWALVSGYRDGMSIDRLDTNGNYEPSNCVWVTRSENSRRAANARWAAHG